MGVEHYLFHQYRTLAVKEERIAYTLHQHEFWQIDSITEGAGRLYCGSATVPFSAGSIIIIPARNPHYFEYDHGSNAWLSIKFSSDCESSLPVCFSGDPILPPALTIIAEALSSAFFSECNAESVVNAALGVITSYFTSRQLRKERPQSDFMRRIQQLVYEAQGRYISISEIGDALGCSGKYAAIRFRAEAGIPLKQFLDWHRGEYATRLLKTSSGTLTEIAAMLDFRDVYAFSRFFRRVIGDSPGCYRRKRLDAR